MSRRAKTSATTHRNISQIGDGFRLRIKTPQGQISQRFEHLDEALIARHRIRLEFPERAQRLRRQRLPGKTSTLPAGVSVCTKTDRHSGRRYRVYQVSWADEQGRGRVSTFQAGEVSALDPQVNLRAKRTAIAFRNAYEFAVDHGMRFLPEFYRSWRTVVCYPFRPPAIEAASAPAPPTIHEALALTRAPKKSEVRALMRADTGIDPFRATILVARFATAERALRFMQADPEEQERLWPVPA